MLAALLLNYPLQGKIYHRKPRRRPQIEELEEEIEVLREQIKVKPERRIKLLKTIQNIRKRIDTLEEEISIVFFDDQIRRKALLLYMRNK